MKLLGNKVNSAAHDYLEQRQREAHKGTSSVTPEHRGHPMPVLKVLAGNRKYTPIVSHKDPLPSLPLNSWLNYLFSLFFFFSNPLSVNQG